MPVNIQYIIFDLGNVLIEVQPEKALVQFARHCHTSPDEIRRFYLSPTHLEFMSGAIPPTKFYHLLLEKYDCNLPFDQFLKIWKSVIAGPKPGMEQLVNKLHSQYTLAICSNTDPWHWEEAFSRCPFLEKFHYYFLSYELMHRKPDQFVFEHMLQKMNATASQCLFIDDTAENVETAKKLGFLVLQAQDATTIENFLEQAGLL